MAETLQELMPFRIIAEDERHRKYLKAVNFHWAQMRIWQSLRKWLFLLGGTQSGKTGFGVHWFDREIQRCGDGDYIVATSTHPLMSLKLLPEFLDIFQYLNKYGKYKDGDKLFEFTRGRKKVFFASATNPEAIESATAKAAWLDEVGQKQFRRETWEAILRRLSIAQGRVLGTTTLYNVGWLKIEVYDKWQKGDPSIEVVQCDSIANPVFPEEEYYRAMQALPEWKFNLFYRGRFSKPAGLIYDAFDEATQVIPRFEIPSNWLRYVGMDFGGVNTCALWYAIDPATGYLYGYREYLSTSKKSAAEHAAIFKNESKDEIIIKIAGGAPHEDGWREAFTNAGWNVVQPKIKEVEIGIDRVYELDKLHKLFIFDDMLGYLDQKQSYARVLDANYEPTDEIEDKQKFHYMDAERYILSDFTPETDVKAQRPRQRVY